MIKQFTFFLILILIFGLFPVNFSNAITQNQINAEVQIVCTDGSGSWFGGSGTIIDPKGIILTNSHIIEDAYQNTCIIGFIESINQEPNFYTEGDLNLAEVKYSTMNKNMDVALLYLDNPNNISYPYVNIWNSNSDNLQFGTEVETIGFPEIGGSTITYTTGDFSGYGSISNNTQNYIKTTAILEHGNSGGAAYDSTGQFIGIPTFTVVGSSNSIGYIFSVKSIKNWFENKFGDDYETTILSYTSKVMAPETQEVPESHNYGKFNDLETICYSTFEEDSIPDYVGIGRCFDKSRGKSEPFNEIQFTISKPQVPGISENGIRHIYYKFGTSPDTILDESFTKYSPYFNTQGYVISDKVSMDQQGIYYFSFFIEDNFGNISDPYIYEYVYEPENFKEMTALSFYKDEDLKNHLMSYNVDYFRETNKYEHRPLECKTRLKNLTISWEYPEYYQNFAVHSSNSWGSLISQNIQGEEVKNKYTFNNLNLSDSVSYNAHYWETSGYLQTHVKYLAFYLKPITLNSTLDYHHQILSLIYNPDLNTDLVCKDGNIFIKRDEYEEMKNDIDRSMREIDWSLINKLKGQILLQVESNGKAYYVYPEDKKAYSLGRPADAFNVMRNLGLGATHDFITSHAIYPTNILGKILIDVEKNGEAYYIYPKDKKAYSLGRPADALKIMRELGLGITNSDLNKIPLGNL